MHKKKGNEQMKPERKGAEKHMNSGTMTVKIVKHGGMQARQIHAAREMHDSTGCNVVLRLSRWMWRKVRRGNNGGLSIVLSRISAVG